MNKTKIFKTKSFLFCGMFLATSVCFFGAVAKAQASTINAASCEQADVQSAINLAQEGDIIRVPAGECIWQSNLSIPDTKKLTVVGSGKRSTVVSGASFDLRNSGSRISGFGFINGILYSYGNGFIIDNCRFEKTGAWGATMIIWSPNTNNPTAPYGLIHSSEFVNVRILSTGTNMMLTDGDGTAQHKLWALPQEFGKYDTVYVEDCTFTNGHSIDGNYGGKFVFRFNKITNGLGIEAHGGQSRMIRGWEIYNNTLVDGPEYMMILLRGGTGFVFNNMLENVNLRFVINRLYEGTNLCDGNSGWDENSGTGEEAGYACRDQIGRGFDSIQWNHNPPQPYAQPLLPAYIWNNVDSGNLKFFSRPFSENHIQPNRDYYEQETISFDGTSGVGVGILVNRPITCTPGVAFWATDQGSWNQTPGGEQGVLYKCTSENTWEKYYEPYTYPHPLRLEDAPAPTIPGDINNDGTVNIFDYNIFLQNFGATDCGNVADLNGDCKVNIFDYNILLQNFGRSN